MFVLAAAVLLVSACSNASTASRSDYADPSFGSQASKRAARETELRKFRPNLSDKQIAEKLAMEFPAGVPRK